MCEKISKFLVFELYTISENELYVYVNNISVELIKIFFLIIAATYFNYFKNRIIITIKKV